MILVLVCPNGHTREIPFAEENEKRLLVACVKARLAKCDVCRRPIVRTEERQLS